MNIISEIVKNDTKQMIYVGIRTEDFSSWERRTPIIPRDVQEIQLRHPHIKFLVKRSTKRIYSDKQYEQHGAILTDDLSKCALILGLKRPKNPSELFDNKTYLFFGHVAKAQPQNMDLLDAMLEKNIRFIDIECMVDERQKRILNLGKFGGCAGTIDFLAGLGQFILQKGYSTPLLNIGFSYKYFNQIDAYEHLQVVSKEIINKKIPLDLCPLIFAITGKGQVAEGTWEVFHNLPIKVIQPDQMEELVKDKHNPQHRTTIYVTTIQLKHLARKIQKKQKLNHQENVFNNEDYKENPEKYEAIFHDKYLPYISVLFNNMYWDSKYKRMITTAQIRKLSLDENLRLLGICDVSCDLKGSIEFLDRYTNPDYPFFTYNTVTEERKDEIKYKDSCILYMAYDSLPCLLPNDSSNHCSAILKKYIPQIAESPIQGSYQNQNLPTPIKHGMITLNGQLTPDYKESITAQRERYDSIKQFSQTNIQSFMAIKLMGHLFDSKAINEITELLNSLSLQFNFADNLIGNKENQHSQIVVQVSSNTNPEKLKTAKYGIQKICERENIMIEDLVNTRELGKQNSSYRMKL